MAFFFVNKDVADQWYWTFLADNHKIIARSSESYINKTDCVNSIRIIKAKAATTNIHDQTDSAKIIN